MPEEVVAGIAALVSALLAWYTGSRRTEKRIHKDPRNNFQSDKFD